MTHLIKLPTLLEIKFKSSQEHVRVQIIFHLQLNKMCSVILFRIPVNLYRQLFQKRKGKEFKMLRINTKCTLSPVCYLSRLKVIKSPANAYQLLEKKKENGTNKEQGPGHRKKKEINNLRKMLSSSTVEGMESLS